MLHFHWARLHTTNPLNYIILYTLTSLLFRLSALYALVGLDITIRKITLVASNTPQRCIRDLQRLL